MLKRSVYFAALCILGCHQNYEEGSHPPPIPPQKNQTPASEAPLTKAPQRESTGEAVISGTIGIDPSLVDRLPKGAVLYIMAKPAPVGPPLAIQRMPVPEFPFTYTITQDDAGMMPGQEVDLMGLDALYISVKIDQDGLVGPAQPGDMEGSAAANPVAPGSKNIDIVIDRVQ